MSRWIYRNPPSRKSAFEPIRHRPAGGSYADSAGTGTQAGLMLRGCLLDLGSLIRRLPVPCLRRLYAGADLSRNVIQFSA
jgi:hypothetical protein